MIEILLYVAIAVLILTGAFLSQVFRSAILIGLAGMVLYRAWLTEPVFPDETSQMQEVNR